METGNGFIDPSRNRVREDYVQDKLEAERPGTFWNVLAYKKYGGNSGGNYFFVICMSLFVNDIFIQFG